MAKDALSGAPIVDADGHVVEPPWIWPEYIEPEYRDHVGTCVQLSDGHDWVIRAPQAHAGDTSQPQIWLWWSSPAPSEVGKRSRIPAAQNHDTQAHQVDRLETACVK